MSSLISFFAGAFLGGAVAYIFSKKAADSTNNDGMAKDRKKIKKNIGMFISARRVRGFLWGPTWSLLAEEQGCLLC